MNTILEYINIAGQWFVEYSFTILIQSSILIAILLLADFVLRKKVRAVFRYWIWMLVLLKLVLPISLSTPVSLGRWFGDELAYMDISQTAKDTEATVDAEAIANTEVAAEAETDFAPAIISTFVDLSRVGADADKPAVTPLIPHPRPASAPVAVKTEPESPSMILLSWQGVVFLLWLAVITSMALLLLQRAIFVRGLIRQARPANNLMNEALEYCCRRMGVEKKVRLKVSVNATSPAVCGLFRPVILLPRNLGPTLGSSHLRTVMMHELAHIKRGDLWINMVQTALQIVYFYNPLFWLANSIIRNVREQAVDETVLVAMGPKARQYPETLLSVARLAFARPALSLRLIGVIESKSQLKERIKKMLERPVPKSAKLGIVGVLIIISLGAFLLPMAKADDSSADVFIVSDSSKKQAEAELMMLQEQIAQLQKQLQQLQKQIKQKKSQAVEETPVKSKKEKQKVDKQAQQVNELADRLRLLIQQVTKEKPIEVEVNAPKKEEQIRQLELILKQMKQQEETPATKEEALELAKKMAHMEKAGKETRERALEIAKKMVHMEQAEKDRQKAIAIVVKEKAKAEKDKAKAAKEKAKAMEAKAIAMEAKDQAMAQMEITKKEAQKALEARDLGDQAKAKLKELLEAIKSMEKQSSDADADAPDADAHAPAKIVLPKLEKLAKLQKLAEHPKPPIPPAPPRIEPHVRVEMPPMPHPVPPIHPEIMIGDITKSMPKIEPPQETFKQLGQIEAKKAALAMEISQLREELEQKKQLGNVSSEEVEALENKVESLEEKIENLEEHSEELNDRIEEWSDRVRERMEEWSERFNEQFRMNFEQKHEKKLKQHEQQMRQYEQQMKHHGRLMQEFERQHEGRYKEELEQYEQQMRQFEKEMEQFERQHEDEYGKQLEDFEHQMEGFEHQMEQWAQQHEHQMDQWAEKFEVEMETSFEGLENELDNIDEQIDELSDDLEDDDDDADDDDGDDDLVSFTKGPNVFSIPLAKGKQVIVIGRVGAIKVKSGEAGQIKCSATIKAKAKTAEEAQQKAESVKIEVDDDNGTLTLKVIKSDNDEWNNINADLDIQVPQNTDIVVNNDVGAIKMTNLKGKIEASTDVGDITVDNVQGDIKLTTDVGKIVCDIPDDISAEVTASTDVGSINTPFPIEVIKSDFVKRRASGVLGDGRYKIELRTQVGAITIK